MTCRLFFLLLIFVLWSAPGFIQAQTKKTKISNEGEAPSATKLLKLARTVEKKTSVLRGLKLRHPIPMGVMSQSEILEFVEKKLAADYTEEELQHEEAVLKSLGLLPAKIDYRATLLALLQEQVAGFYDPESHRLNLADWLPLNLQEPALSHEICHGLQDQQFKLKNIIKPYKQNSDKQLALAAFIEGDCTAVMIEYLLAPLGRDIGSMGDTVSQLAKSAMVSSSGNKLKNAPLFLQETLLFPYIAGIAFMQKVRARSSWATVDKMYKRLPESTEQIIHPEKYGSAERPAVIRPKTLPALQAYTKIKTEVLGEFQLSLLLQQAVDAATAKRAAEGWNGDLLVATEGKTEAAPLLNIHLSSWDTQADALEFINAMKHFLSRKRTAMSESSLKEVWSYKDRDGYLWSTEKHGQQVLTLMGVPAEIYPTLRQEILESWTVNGGKIISKRHSPKAP